LLKNLKGKDKPMANLSVQCFIDLYRAANFLHPSLKGSGPLLFASQLEDVLREHLLWMFAGGMPLPPGTYSGPAVGSGDDHEIILFTDYIVACYIRNQTPTVNKLFVMLTEGSSEQKLALSKALLALNCDPFPAPEISDSNSIKRLAPHYPIVAEHMRQLFKAVTGQYSDLLEVKSPNGTDEDHGGEADEVIHVLVGSGLQREGSTLHLLHANTPTKESLPKKTGGLFKKGDKDSDAQVKRERSAKITFETLSTVLYLYCGDPTLFLETSQSLNKTLTKPTTSILHNEQTFKDLSNVFINTQHPALAQQASRLFRKIYLEKYISLWQPKQDMVVDQLMTYAKLSTTVLDRLSGALLAISNDRTVSSLLSVLRHITYCGKRHYLRYQKSLTPDLTNARWRTNAIERLASNLLVCLCSPSVEIWNITTRCLRDLCDQIEIMSNQDSKYLNYLFYRQLTSVDIIHATDAIAVDKERGVQIQLFRRVEIQTKTNLAAFDEIHGRWKESIVNFNQSTRDAAANYTAFMCALGGVCLHDNESKSLENFLNDLMEQLVTEDPQVRILVGYSMAKDLAPALYDRLFFHMLKALRAGTDSVTPSTKNDTLVDHIIDIVRVIVASKETTYDLALATEFDTLVMILFDYFLTSFKNKRGNDLKIQLCQLAENIVAKSEYITFKDQAAFRTKVLKHLIEWCSSGVEDVEANAVRALSSILGDYTISNDRADEYEKYFKILVDLLNKSKVGSVLRDHLVNALAQLLNCNVSLGLEHYMGMVYAKDENIRSIFINLIARLLKKGKLGFDHQGEEEKEEVNENAKVVEEVVDPYVDMARRLLFAFDKGIIFELFNQTKNPEKDELCEAIIRVFMKVGGEAELLQLLKKSVTLEVDSTEHPETLFRANSAASKLMKSYCTRTCQYFMQHSIGGMMDKIIADATKFEIDPEKAAQRNEDVNVNTENVLKVTQQFVDAIVNSVKQTPRTYREYCRYLSNFVGEKFPGCNRDGGDTDDAFVFEFKYIAVGGFLFLRLFCPAITTPQVYGLNNITTTDGRRYCIVLTKLLQNIANGVYKSQKEVFMVNFEDMILKSMTAVKDYFDHIVEEDEQTEQEQSVDIVPEKMVSADELKDAFFVIHRYFQNYSESLRPYLQKNAAYDEFTKVLNGLGKAPEAPKKERATAKVTKGNTAASEEEYSSARYKEFMKKMSIKDKGLMAWQNVKLFYTGEKNDKNQHMVYFVPSKLINTKNNSIDDWDLIAYLMFHTMEPIFKEPYNIVVDCTSWRGFQSIPFSAVLRFVKLFPSGAKKNLREVLVINPNSTFRECTKRLSQLGDITKFKWHFLDSTMTDLKTRMSLKTEPVLPETTLKIKESIEGRNIKNLVNVSSGPKDCTIGISSDRIWIFTKDEKFMDSVGLKVDDIPLEYVHSVEAKRTLLNVSKKDFVIKYLEDPADQDKESQVVIRSTDLQRDTSVIQQYINTKKTSNINVHQDQKETGLHIAVQPKKRRLKPSDVPGQLLSISFLNLESQNPQTRLSSYNLLTSIIATFQLPIHNVLESDLIAVPRNTEDLVLDLSEKMAIHKADLTLEFMTEALKAFAQIEPKSQIMCAKILKPWIKNLAQFYSEEENKKSKMLQDWFEMLTRVSCSNAQVFPALAEIWTLISNEKDTMLFMGLDSAIKYGVEIGIEGDQQLVGDLIITLASHCPKEANVAMRIIDKILDLLSNEVDLDDLGKKSAKEIYPDAAWAKIFLYTRYLMMLSFQNRLDVDTNLPYLIHIIMLLVGQGDHCMRSTVHALSVNILHTMTESIAEQHERPRLISLSSQLKERPLLENFLGAPTKEGRLETSPFSIPTLTDTSKTEPIGMREFEQFTDFFIQTVGSIGKKQQVWMEQWKDLSKGTIGLCKVPLFMRAIVPYSHMCASNMDVAKMMIPYMLDFLAQQQSQQTNNDFVLCVLLSINAFLKEIDLTENNELLEVVNRMYVMSIMMLIIADQRLMLAIIDLLITILDVLYHCRCFTSYHSIGEHFNAKFRSVDALHQFEALLGISFAEHFSFAFAILIQRALVDDQTRGAAIALVKQFLIISNKLEFPTVHSLGFITALIPFERQYNSPLYCDYLFQVCIV
jgi:hypothetical protein